MAKKNIVVLGAGFGGLRAATLIAKKLRALHLIERYAVMLIDRNDHHTYTPLLYEVATTSKTTAGVGELHDIASQGLLLLTKSLPITFIQGEIEQIDLMEGDVHLRGGREIKSDYVILALGSEVNFFGIPELKENSLTLKTFQDAVRVRSAIWNLAMERRGDLNIVVGGGGSTGVELAGELEEWCGELGQELPKCRLNISVIEAAPTVLMGFDERVIDRVQKRLSRLGIRLMTNKKILSLSRDKVMLEGGEKISFDIFIWTGGVKAPELISGMPLATDRGRPLVGGELQCVSNASDLKFYPRVYGLGDSVCFHDPKTGRPIPQVAPAAISQADVVAHNVIEDVKKEENPDYKLQIANYRPKSYPYIIPVGGKYAVVKIGPFVISGLFGWVFKGLVELDYLLSIMPVTRAFKVWFKGLKIFMQNDRLG